MRKNILRVMVLLITLHSLIIPNVYAIEYKTWGDFVYVIKDGYAFLREYIGNDENVTVPNELDGYKVVGIDHFYYNADKDNPKTAKTVIISEGIEYIGDYAFSESYIETVIISNTITCIERKAFYKCTSLTEITIPESVTEIGDSAFEECENLVTANILGNVVGSRMFKGCDNLTMVNLGNDVTTIGKLAFLGCKNITEITVPESATTIGNGAFESTGIESVIIPENVTEIDYNAFLNCKNMKNVILKNPDTKFMEEDGVTDNPYANPEKPTFFSSNNLSTFYAFKGSQAEEYSLKNDLEFVPVARVEVNGESVKTDVPPIIKNNRVLIPMRAIFEALGAEIDWNGETRTVLANTEKDSVRCEIDNNLMTVNGVAKTLDVAPEILMNRTLVPARAVSESLGADVEWDEARQTVVIRY